jgi:hypothetical protein
MTLAQTPDDVGLDHRESFGHAVFQVLIKLVAIEPLKEQPAGICKVQERLAVLVYKVTPVWADLESQVLDRG